MASQQPALRLTAVTSPDRTDTDGHRQRGRDKVGGQGTTSGWCLQSRVKALVATPILLRSDDAAQRHLGTLCRYRGVYRIANYALPLAPGVLVVRDSKD